MHGCWKDGVHVSWSKEEGKEEEFEKVHDKVAGKVGIQENKRNKRKVNKRKWEE